MDDLEARAPQNAVHQRARRVPVDDVRVGRPRDRMCPYPVRDALRVALDATLELVVRAAPRVPLGGALPLESLDGGHADAVRQGWEPLPVDVAWPGGSADDGELRVLRRVCLEPGHG